MATFTVGKAIATTTPSIVVDAGLPVGQHRFQLMVMTDTGQRSQPDIATIDIQKPIIVIQPSPVIVPPVVVRSPTPLVAPGFAQLDLPLNSPDQDSPAKSAAPRLTARRKPKQRSRRKR